MAVNFCRAWVHLIGRPKPLAGLTSDWDLVSLIQCGRSTCQADQPPLVIALLLQRGQRWFSAWRSWSIGRQPATAAKENPRQGRRYHR